MNNSFVMYRLPHETTCTIMRQCDSDAEILTSYDELSGRTGFVFSPFMISADHPLLLIRPDEVKTCEVSDCAETEPQPFECRNTEKERLRYESNFTTFHTNLQEGNFRKIVLARSSDETACKVASPEEIFRRACCMYPNEFVALVSTPYSGTWLMATPETLVEGCGDEWHTVALAGTKRMNDGDESCGQNDCGEDISKVWDQKNIHEQQYVADYIRECLNNFTHEIEETEPKTLVAGRLMHIVTHFRFKLKDHDSLGRLVGTLHPTPAVCGLPKDKAYKFILENENGDRGYYSGFSGPLNINCATHLFVTLRCMQISGRSYRLYAGGGLLSESKVETEWLETEAKMDTMRRCLAIKRI